MKRLPLLLLILALAFIVAISAIATDATMPVQTTSTETTVAAAAAIPKVEWLDFEKGLAMQAKTGKHMLVDFTASWCGWCRKMEKETFSQPDVVQMINENFVPVKVWGDSDKELVINGYKISEKNLASEFKVTGFPCFWFLSAEGTRIGPLRGYSGPEPFMKNLVYVKDFQYDTARVAAQRAQAGAAAQTTQSPEPQTTEAQKVQPDQN